MLVLIGECMPSAFPRVLTGKVIKESTELCVGSAPKTFQFPRIA